MRAGPADPAQRDEAALLAALRQGSEQAFERLVREHTGHLLAVARRMLGNEADAADAVQQAFLSAFKSLDSFSGESRLSTWLHRIVVNACLMKLRTDRRRPATPIEDLLPKFKDDGHQLNPARNWKPIPESVIQASEVGERVREAIAELPDSLREVLILRDVEEIDTRAAAAHLGISESAVKTRLHRARQALRELLDPYFRETSA
jgi:RNA polymerase sigma-70 factor (ECF subfamily)